MKISYKRIEIIVMQIAVILTILSFSPEQSLASVCGVVMFAFWGMVVLFKVLNKHLYLDNYVKYIVTIYAIWYVCTKIFFNMGLYQTGGMGVARYLLYCAIFYVIGLNFESSESNVKSIINAFFVGEVLLTITLLPYLEAIYAARYDFLSKNQMGQMLGTCVTVGFFILFRQYKNIAAKIVALVLASVSLMSLLIVGSRTPLIAIVVIAVVSFISKKQKTVRDYILALAIVIAAVVTVSLLGGIEFIEELFKFGEAAESVDINNMTSGRFTLYVQALGEFAQNPIIGLGAYAYVDNFIINIIRCGGLLLLVLILPISYGKMYTTYKKANLIASNSQNEMFVTTIKLLLIFYFVVSLMEGYPPMGPGTSVFFLWILIGIMSRKGSEAHAAES